MSLAFFISDSTKELNMCACNETFISCSDVLWPDISPEINNCSTNLYPDANKFELAPSNELNSFNLIEFLTQISLSNSIRLEFKNINTFKLFISQDTTGISLEMNKNLLHISNSKIDFNIGDDDDSILFNSNCFINTTANSYEKTLFSYFSTVYLDFNKHATLDRLDLCSLVFLNSNLDTLKLVNIIKNEKSLFIESRDQFSANATIKNLVFRDAEFNAGFSLNTDLFKSIESIRFENTTLRSSPYFDLSSFERLDHIKLELANFEQFISSFNSLRFMKPFRQNLVSFSKENFAVLEFNDPSQTFKYPDEHICNFVLNLNLTNSYTFPLFNYNPFLKPKQLDCTCTLLFLIKSYDNECDSFLFESELNAASECYRNYAKKRVELSCDFENITQSCLQFYTTTTTTTTTTTPTTTSTTTTITSTTTSVTTSTTPTETTTSTTEAKTTTTASSTLPTDTSSNEPTSLAFNTTKTGTTSTSSTTRSSTSTTTLESTSMGTQSTSRSTQSTDEDSTSSTQPTSSTSSTSSTIPSTNPTTTSRASSTVSNTTQTTSTMVTTGSTSFTENTTAEAAGPRVDIIVPSVLAPVVVVVAAGVLVYFRRELKDFVKCRSRAAVRADVFGSLNKFKLKIPNSFVSAKAQV